MDHHSATRALLVAFCVAVASGCGDGPSEPQEGFPPLGPTIHIDPDIIRPDDPTAFVSAVPTGMGQREMFDGRIDALATYDAYLFDATYDDGLSAEIEVNAEFDSTAAVALAETYGEVIGRLPHVLREDVTKVWIHDGVEDFGGGDGALLIHTGQADLYEDEGILEEALVHEAVHASLDAEYANAPGWIAAQTSDNNFISMFAKENPTTEDVAETFVPFIAVRYRTDRITSYLFGVIMRAIEARVLYLDAQGFDMYPID